ncbi:MAG: AtpZ/AtpI family protein [Campylobacterota bacterium]|nr:AtpZ/AtpI family protein [Campylobacterota bacterium]
MEENKNPQEVEHKPKHKDKLEALDNMSLGISIVVALALGVGLGLLLKSWTGYTWTLWIGVAYGIAAAVLNVQKAYKKAKKDLDKLAQDPKYKYAQENGYGNKLDDEDDAK